MSDRHISIITGAGDDLGTGHLQRMANLCDFLDRKTSFRSSIAGVRTPEFVPSPLCGFLSPDVIPGSACLIRDRRDSTIEEMIRLKKHGPVLAVDDCGPGRDRADLAIDLLPNLHHPPPRNELFIYGYNFTDSLRSLGNASIEKTIDVAMYAGSVYTAKTVDSLLSLLPESCTCAVLAGENSRLIRNGKQYGLASSYAEALLSSKVLVSHFGITLYEGLLAGCRLIAINPTPYHSMLADAAAKAIELTNLGLLAESDRDVARSVISSAFRRPVVGSVRPADLVIKIEAGLEAFQKNILGLIGN